MNYINTNIFISFFLGIIFCFAGRYIKIQNHSNELVWAILCCIMALPALSFALYYLHLVKPPIAYIQFRAIPYIEILSSLIGITMGYFIDKNLIINTLLASIVILQQFRLWKKGIQWENGWGGFGRFQRIFGTLYTDFKQKNQKKSVSIRRIRRIRSPIV